MLIDKPGFYTSKAGKCEVVAINDGVAFGFANMDNQKFACVWDVYGGRCSQFSPRCDITSAYIDPPKPIEAYAVVTEIGRSLHPTKYDAIQTIAGLRGLTPRLVHLREVTEEG